jgi:hypothetical protein
MIGSLVLGGIQTVGGLIAALGMGRRPRFTEDSRFTQAAGRAEYMAGMGYTPQERASFQSDIAAQTAGDYRRGIDMSGGNMARALGGISTARTMGAYNRFAGQDAALRRQNIQYSDQFSRDRQRRMDMQTRADMAQYDAAQQAVGKAMSSGLTGLAEAGNFGAGMNYSQNIGMMGNVAGDLAKVQEEMKGLGADSERLGSLKKYENKLRNFGSGGFFNTMFGSYPQYPADR